MKGFLIAAGYILCFLIGCYVSWRFSEYYNRRIQDAREDCAERLIEAKTHRPRPVKPDLFNVKEDKNNEL